MQWSKRTICLFAASLAGVASSALAQVKWEALHEPGCGGAMVSISASPHDSRRMLVAGDMLGVGYSTDAGNSWKWSMGLKGWEMGDSSWSPADPKVVWMGSMEGPYLSTDGGMTWTEKRVGMPAISPGSFSVSIEKVLFDRDQPGRLLAFGGNSRRMINPAQGTMGVVWESLDSGEHWKKLTVITAEGSNPGAERGLNIVAASYLGNSSSKLMALGDGAGVFVSDNDGKSWQKSNGGLPAKGFDLGRLAVHPTDPNIAYIGLAWTRDDNGKVAPGAIFKTSDGGKTWAKKAKGLGQVITDPNNQAVISNYSAIAVAPSSPNILYTCDGSWAQGIIYKSTDGGESWSPNCTRGQRGQKDNEHVGKIANLETATFAGLSMGLMAIAPTNPDAVYAINTEYIARTLDGGKTWDDATAFRPDPSKPDNWRGRGYSGWCSTNVVFHPKNPNTSILLAMDAGRGWLSTDGLKSWKYIGQEPWAWGGSSGACFSGDVIYYTGGQGSNLGLHKYANGKQTVMVGAKYGLPERDQGGQPTSIYATFADPSHVWATIGGKLYASANGGEKWELIAGDKGIEWIAGDPTKPTRMYMSGSAGVYVCEDGKTLKNIGGPKPAGRGKIHVDAKGRVLVALWRASFGGLWRYDAGKWSRLSDNAFIQDVAVDAKDPTRLAAATGEDNYHDYTNATGIWISSDDGKTWSQANTGLPMLRFQCIAFNPHNSEQLIAGSFGSGFFLGTWPQSYKMQGTVGYQMTAEDTDFAAADDGAPATTDKGGLFNGSMSAVGGAGPAGWTDTWADIKVKRDKSVYHSAPASLRGECIDGKQGQVHQTLDFKPGQKIKVSGWMKTQGGAKVNFMVQPRNEGWTPVGFVQVGFGMNDSDWRFYEKEVEMPAGTARASIGMLIEGAGVAWLDDVKVEPMGNAATPVPTAAAATAATPAVADGKEPAISMIIRDFGPQGLDYTYDGTSWKNGQNITAGEADGVKYAQLDVTEHGGGGLVLNGLALAPHGEKFLALRARLVEGNEAATLHVNVNRDGAAQLGYDFPLSKFRKDRFTTITIPLGDEDVSKIAQVQFQGTNFSPGAKALKIQLDKLGTTTGEAVISDEIKKAIASDPRSSAPAADKPWVAGWGFWHDFPHAWMAMHNGLVDRAKKGDIDVAFFGDSITQGWNNDASSLFQKYYGGPYKAANFGIGGDTTRQVIWRMQNGELDGYKAKLFVIKIGTNNLYSDGNAGSDEEIAKGIKEVVKTIQAK